MARTEIVCCAPPAGAFAPRLAHLLAPARADRGGMDALARRAVRIPRLGRRAGLGDSRGCRRAAFGSGGSVDRARSPIAGRAYRAPARTTGFHAFWLSGRRVVSQTQPGNAQSDRFIRVVSKRV